MSAARVFVRSTGVRELRRHRRGGAGAGARRPRLAAAARPRAPRRAAAAGRHVPRVLRPGTCCRPWWHGVSTARPASSRWPPARRCARCGDPLPWARERVGVCAGTWNAGTVGARRGAARRLPRLARTRRRPPQFPSTVANAPASQLGILEKLGGPNLTFAEKQVGGLRAVAEAAGTCSARAGRRRARLRRGRGRLAQRRGVRPAADAAHARPARAWCSPRAQRCCCSPASPDRRRSRCSRAGARRRPATAPHRYPSDPAPLVAACRQALQRAGLEPARRRAGGQPRQRDPGPRGSRAEGAGSALRDRTGPRRSPPRSGSGRGRSAARCGRSIARPRRGRHRPRRVGAPASPGRGRLHRRRSTDADGARPGPRRRRLGGGAGPHRVRERVRAASVDLVKLFTNRTTGEACG